MAASHTFMRMLIEREPFMLAKAEEAKAEGKTATEVMYRSLAVDAAILYAAFVGDNPRAAVAEHQRHLLQNAVNRMDEELLDYRVLMAQAELEKPQLCRLCGTESTEGEIHKHCTEYEAMRADLIPAKESH